MQTAQTASYLETGAYAEETSALAISLSGETEDNKFIMPDAQYSSIEIYAGGTCESHSHDGCRYAKVYAGGTCEAVENIWGCENATIYEGRQCIAHNWTGCYNMTVDGGVCVAKVQNECSANTYLNGGCCEDYGKGYCPSNAPKC